METEVAVALIGGGFAALNIIITAVMNYINKKQAQRIADQSSYQEEVQKKLDDYGKRLTNLEIGLQSLLRLEIIRSHEKYTTRKFCPVYAKESLNRAYKAYHELGGNDVATDLYNEIMNLPIERPTDED